MGVPFFGLATMEDRAGEDRAGEGRRGRDGHGLLLNVLNHFGRFHTGGLERFTGYHDTGQNVYGEHGQGNQ
jgi:hypothetical protein